MNETVDFDGYPDTPVDSILQIIEGYCQEGEPDKPKIIVVLTNGAVLHLDSNDRNKAAVAKWRASKKSLIHSG